MTTTPEQTVIQAALLPCDFCGGTDAFVERADFSSCYVMCNDCSARGPVSCDETDEDADASEEELCEPGEMAARRLWNTRLAHSQPASEGLREAIAAAIRGKTVEDWLDWRDNATTYPNSYQSDIDATYARADRVLAALQPLTEPQRLGQEGRHTFVPHSRYPWFCGECGYPPHEVLKHVAESDRQEGEALRIEPAEPLGTQCPDCQGEGCSICGHVGRLFELSPTLSTPAQAEPVADLWSVGTLVRKRSGGQWHGRVCGYYTTDLTTEGYAVESLREPGSVQIYPRKALELWEGDALPLLGAEEREERG